MICALLLIKEMTRDTHSLKRSIEFITKDLQSDSN